MACTCNPSKYKASLGYLVTQFQNRKISPNKLKFKANNKPRNLFLPKQTINLKLVWEVGIHLPGTFGRDGQ